MTGELVPQFLDCCPILLKKSISIINESGVTFAQMGLLKLLGLPHSGQGTSELDERGQRSPQEIQDAVLQAFLTLLDHAPMQLTKIAHLQFEIFIENRK